jgi:hypothetical protein
MTTTAWPCPARWRPWEHHCGSMTRKRWPRPFPDYFARFAEVGQTVPVIAIDGTSASGKGTIAARVAQALGWHYLDSGALYRLTALAAQRRSAWDDEDASRRLLPVSTSSSSAMQSSCLARKFPMPSAARRFLPALREWRLCLPCAPPAVPAAGFSSTAGTRCRRARHGLGRFPRCATKVFLTASVEMRAMRRHKQLIEKGMAASIADLLLDLRERDERDSQRSVAPMQQSTDAASARHHEPHHRNSGGTGAGLGQQGSEKGETATVVSRGVTSSTRRSVGPAGRYCRTGSAGAVSLLPVPVVSLPSRNW